MPFSPLPSPVIPLPSYPAIRYTIRGRHPSSFISRTPRSRTTCYSPRFLLTHIARLTGRASLIFPISALLCACALVLTLYLYLSSPSPPPPPSFLSSFGPCFPFPLSPSHPLSPPPPSHRLITLVHDPDMHASFPLRILSQHILSLYYSSTRIYSFSLGYANINALFAAFFPLRPSFSLLSHLCADWLLGYNDLHISLSESYFVLLSLFLSLSLFPVPVFVLFCLPHLFIVEVTVL